MNTRRKIIPLILVISIIFCMRCQEKVTVSQPLFNIYPATVDFSEVPRMMTVGTELTITNKGGGELQLTNFELLNNDSKYFKCNAKPIINLGQNETYKFDVSFNPLQIGLTISTLSITANGKQHEVILRGYAVKNEKDKVQDAWLFFKDKPSAKSFFNNPTKMLSNRALERRKKQGIAVDTIDVPIEHTYYQKVKSFEGIEILAKSKWLNAVHIQGKICDIDTVMKKCSFISRVEYANKFLDFKNKSSLINNQFMHINKFEHVLINFDYGESTVQTEMMNLNFLHKKEFTGEGIIIAIIDGGFPNVDKLSCFQRLREKNKILGGYDFVDRNKDFYVGSSHGTHVLSTIAGYIQNESTKYVGTAPDASFYLFRTENGSSESTLEESLWVEAAEKADSLGVDIINSSLGYTTFDNPQHNYTYDDLDGKTAFITRGAEIGASRGMILVNAAGNAGNKAWKHIGVPADAKSVLTVGAVGEGGIVATFSSRGPTADGRLKPDVMAMGRKAIVLNYTSGNPVEINGTSFSSPIMAGAVACLWQARPNKKASEIVEFIKKGSDNFAKPNNNYGYGIPDFEKIYTQLE